MEHRLVGRAGEALPAPRSLRSITTPRSTDPIQAVPGQQPERSGAPAQLPRFGWQRETVANELRIRSLTRELLDEWLETGEPIRWTPSEPGKVTSLASRRRDAHRRLKHTVMVAATVAAVATGSMLQPGAASASNPALGPTAPGGQPAAGGGNGTFSYTVQPGDTIRDIAARFGVAALDVIGVNDLPNPDLIFPGQVINVPGSEPGTGETEGVTVEVKWGDTLWKLAQRYGVDTQRIVDHAPNGIHNPDLIYAGQHLFIPGGQEAPAPAEDEAAAGGGEAEAALAQAAPPAPAQPAPTEPPQAPAPATKPFIWPTSGAITQKFGPSDLWLEPAYMGHPHFHQGLDIGNKMYTPIVAAAGGTVTFAGWSNAGYGYAVQIDHGNGLVTLYGHMAEPPAVQQGQQVNQGQFIGHMGSTGASTGPHLHFAVLENGTWVDPLNYLP